jgi:hypothetical protein
MTCSELQTTADLIESVLQDNYATEREIVLASRLMGALEEIDTLNKEVIAEARQLATSIHGDT